MRCINLYNYPKNFQIIVHSKDQRLHLKDKWVGDMEENNQFMDVVESLKGKYLDKLTEEGYKIYMIGSYWRSSENWLGNIAVGSVEKVTGKRGKWILKWDKKEPLAEFVFGGDKKLLEIDLHSPELKDKMEAMAKEWEQKSGGKYEITKLYEMN